MQAITGTLERLDGALPEGISRKTIYADIGRITIPAFVELLLTQLTSMVDLMMVGSIGAWAITAVGLTTQPKFLLLSVFMAMNTGATAMVARFKGAGERGQANAVMAQSIMATLVLSAVAAVLGAVFAEPLIRFMGMGAQEEMSIAGGVEYFRIQMYGFLPLAVTASITATLRGVGSTRISMVYNLISNVVSVLFNWLLIYGNLFFPQMGVAGASLATVLGQCTAFFIAAFVMLTGGKRDQYLFIGRHTSFKPNLGLLKRVARIGLPAMFEQLVMRVGMISYTTTVSSLGTLQYATHLICFNLQALSFMLGDAFAITAVSLTGQSLGKKRPDIAVAVVKRTRRMAILCGCVLGVLAFTLGGLFVSLYNDDPAIIAMGADILRLMAFIMPFQAIMSVTGGALRGAGDTKATALFSLIGMVIMRPGLAYLFVNTLQWGLMGAWYAICMDQMARVVLYVWRYARGAWKKMEV